MAKKRFVEFKVKGPFKIPIKKGKSGKLIVKEKIKNFWKARDLKVISKKKGYYVFCIKAAKGSTPWYAGKTRASMENECFLDDKIRKYYEAINSSNGTPVIYLIIANNNQFKRKYLAEMEKFLIQQAKIKNPNLLNKQHTKNLPEWGIKGVVRSSKGGPTRESKLFIKMIGI